MQITNTMTMPRLSRLAARNRRGGLRVLLTTALIVGGTTLTSLVALTSLSGIV